MADSGGPPAMGRWAGGASPPHASFTVSSINQSINQSIEKSVYRLQHSPERQRLTIKNTRPKQFNKSTIKSRKLNDKI